MKRLQLIEITPDDLASLIAETVKTELEAFKKEFRSGEVQDDLLTREEAAKLLKIHETTLWHWTNNGKVTAYGISGKRFYKRSELLDALTKLEK